MVWERGIKEECAALMRLVASLHLLAVLAEGAAYRSPAARIFVLWALRCAEAIAWDFVVGDADLPACAASPHMAPESGGIGPEDALDLAETFRALAWLLETEIGFLLALGGGYPGRGEHKLSGGYLATTEAHRSAFCAIVALTRSSRATHLAPDTS